LFVSVFFDSERPDARRTLEEFDRSYVLLAACSVALLTRAPLSERATGVVARATTARDFPVTDFPVTDLPIVDLPLPGFPLIDFPVNADDFRMALSALAATSVRFPLTIRAARAV